MLLTNQRLDKLAAARIDFTKQGMLSRTKLKAALKMISKCASYVHNLFHTYQLTFLMNRAHQESLQQGEQLN